MSVSRNILSSALFSMPFLGYQPVDISNGEPALGAANLVKQAMLGPPFKWPWNRGSFHIDLDPDETDWGQDYLLNIPDFNFCEKVWLTDPDGNVTEITNIVSSLSTESVVKRPSSASMYTQDEDGNVIFRVNTMPDKAYQIDGFYQRAPVWMTSMASRWAPIPDHLAYIYDW